MTDLTFFTSRPWLQDRVDGWLAGGPDVGRVLVISGGPGTGKSRFLHELCRDLTDSPPPGGVQLAGAILRDLRGNRSDELSWAKLKSELLKLVGSPSPTISHPSALVHQNVETIAPGAQVIGQMITALLLNNDPLQELREAVLPLLADLPSGPPLLLVVDGLDEAFRDQAMEFLSVVSRLADAISRAPDGQKGIGRLRILVASQPEVPIEINPLRPPVTVDLARPDDSDQADLTRYCTALLADLPSDHRETLAHEIAKNAAGVWVWAFYVATTVAEDFANGEPIPRTVTAPRSLQEVYREALERARSRLRDRWQTGAELIALVAASQDVGAMLPKDIALAVLGVDGAGLANLLKDLKALVAPTSKGEYRFWHGDFGRWIVEGGYELANVRDAHDRLANFTVQVGTGGWSFAGPYARNYVMPHALAAAESDLGSVQLRSSLGRCLQLLQEVDLLAEDADCPGEYPNVRNWLDYLQRLSCITPGATRIAGAAPLTGLTSTLYRLLQSHVGARLAARMSDAQLQRFSALLEDGEQQGALALLDDVQPTRVVVAEELRRLWGRVLNGWRPAVDLGWSAFMVAIDLRRQWQATKVPSLLDRAIEAYEESLQHADPEAPYFTDRMIGFANSLIRRVGTEGERPDDLDRLILAQAEILGRQDLEGAALVSAQSVTGFWLEHRWLQDPEGHSDDLDSAVEAYTRALSLSSDDADQRIDLTTSLVRALGRRIDTPREATDDLDRVIALQAQVVGRLDRKSALAYWVCGFWLDVRWGRDPDGRGDDLDHAVEAYLQALELTPPDDPMRTDRMIGLANGLNRRLGTDGERSDDLDRLVALHSEIAARPDLSDPGQAHEFRGNVLEQRWERDPEGRRGDLDAAVEAYAQALELTAADDPQRTDRMISVANGLTRRVGTQGERSDDLDRLVALHSEIAGRSDLRDPGNVHEFRGNVLEQRWKRDPEGRRGDLDAAVEAYAQALELTAADDPQRTDRMISVANGLTRRLGTQGERSDDLDRLVALHSEIAARPDLPNPAQAQTFRGNALRGRWMRDPESRGDDLDAAVESYVRALELTGDDDPQRTDRMIGLANCVSRRVDTDGELPEDLDRLVALHADIAGRPDLVDPGEACAFHGNALRRRWERDPESRGDDLDAAVEAFVRALKLTGEADPQRTDRMMGLANCVSRRVDTDGELPDDLDRLIALQTEIIARSDIEELALSAAYSVSGFWLQRRWERDPEGRGDDLDAAVAAYAAALALTSDDGAHRTELMAGIGHLLARRVGSSREQADDVDRLIDLHKAILARADLDTQERTANANGLFGYWLFYRWNRGSIANGLDIHDAVEALERAVGNDPLALVPTERLVTLANALSGRLNGRTGDDEVYERSGDIDRMIEVERELLTRSDLADTAQAYAIYARWLLERWNREPSSNDDLREALSAAQAASDKTTAQADENIRRYRKAQLANLHLLCYVNKVPGASMGESVLLAESVMVSHDVGTDGLLPVLRRLTRQRSVDGAVQQGNK